MTNKTLIAKPVVKNQFWIVTDGKSKVGNVLADGSGFEVKLNGNKTHYKNTKSIEKIANIDSTAQLLASILSKKISVGSKYILIDIPFGKSAKVSRKHAEVLKNKFLQLGKKFTKKKNGCRCFNFYR